MNVDRVNAKRYLDLAARAAWRAVGDVEPGVPVGAVIVRNNTVIGIGHHRRFALPHAEPEALQDCARRGIDPRGATMYVTLEPCASQGKQPPCVDAVIRAGIARVVCARRDPHPTKGGGAEKLRAAGVQFEFTGASTHAIDLSEPFIKRITTDQPWVIAKWAQTIDGRIATRAGESKWISNEASRRGVHRLRARADAIITGLGTVRADDPMLTARGVARVRRLAARVVVDTSLDIDPACALIRTAHEHRTILACSAAQLDKPAVAEKSRVLQDLGATVIGINPSVQGIDLRALLRTLRADHNAHTAMVEAGPRLLGSMLEAGVVDEAVVYIAPLVLADEHAATVAQGRIAPRLADASRWRLLHHSRVGDDVRLIYRAGRTHPQ